MSAKKIDVEIRSSVAPASPGPLPTRATPVIADNITADNGVLVFAQSANIPCIYPYAYGTQCVRMGETIAAVPMKKMPIQTLVAAHSREFNQVEVQFSKFPIPQGAAIHEFRQFGEREFDWTCSEGAYNLMHSLKSGTATTVMQRIPHPVPMHMLEGISCLNMKAKHLNSYVLMFANFADPADCLFFRDVTSELFEITPCESDPGKRSAFSIQSTNSNHGLLIESGNSMVQVNVAENGHHTFSTEDFIATTVTDRVAWRMRSEGASLADIGATLGLDKSTVKRRLDKLPPPRASAVTDGWRRAYKSLFEVPDPG